MSANDFALVEQVDEITKVARENGMLATIHELINWPAFQVDPIMHHEVLKFIECQLGENDD